MRTAKTAEPILCGCTHLKMASRSIGRMYDEALAAVDLNCAQFAILSNADRNGEMANIELAALLHLERTTLYRAIAILERRKLLSTRPAEQGRDRFVSVTAAGRRLLEKARPLWADAQARFTRHMGDERWSELLRLLKLAQLDVP